MDTTPAPRIISRNHRIPADLTKVHDAQFTVWTRQPGSVFWRSEGGQVLQGVQLQNTAAGRTLVEIV